MRWPFRSRGAARVQGDGPGEEAVRPSGEWRELPAATRVLRPQPTANSRGFVRTLPSRWRQPAVLAPLGHDVTADAPSGSVAGLAVGVDLPAGVTQRPPAGPAGEAATGQPVTGRARAPRGLPGVSLLRRPRPARVSGGSRPRPEAADGGHGALPGPGRAGPLLATPPNAAQPLRAGLGAALPTGQTALPTGQTASAPVSAAAASASAKPGLDSPPSGGRSPASARSASPGQGTLQAHDDSTAPAEPVSEMPWAAAAVSPPASATGEAPSADQGGTPAAGYTAAASAASTPIGEGPRTRPWAAPAAAAQGGADARAFPTGANRVARDLPEIGERPATPVAPAGVAPAGVAPAGVAPAGVAPAGVAPAGPGTGILPAGPDVGAPPARLDAGSLPIGVQAEASPGAAGAGSDQQERSAGLGPGLGSPDAAGARSRQVAEPAGPPGSPSGRLRRRRRLGPPLTGPAGEQAAGLGTTPPASPSAQAASSTANLAPANPPVSPGAGFAGPPRAGTAITPVAEPSAVRGTRPAAPLPPTETAGLPVVTAVAPAAAGHESGQRAFAPLTSMRTLVNSRTSLASRSGSPPGIEAGGPGPRPAVPGTATMLAADLAPGPPPGSSAVLGASADRDPAGRYSASVGSPDSAAAGGIPASGVPGSMAGGSAAGDQLAAAPPTRTRQRMGAEAGEAPRQSIGPVGSIMAGGTQGALSAAVTRSWPQAGLPGPNPDGWPGSTAPAASRLPPGDDRPWSPPGRRGNALRARPPVPAAQAPVPHGSVTPYQPALNRGPGSPVSPYPVAGPVTADSAAAGPVSDNSATAGSATAGPATAGPAAADPTDPASLDRLAQRLYGRLRGHLAAELLADREHAQLLTDL
jgi:hypothetical protein